MTRFLVPALGLLVVAWLSAGAMAVRSASRIWLRHWAERSLRGASTVLVYLERPQRLLAAANAATALVLGAVGAWIGWRMADRPGTALAWMAGYAVLVVFLGSIGPRVLARRFPSAFIPICMPALRVAHFLMAPLLNLGRAMAGGDLPSRTEAPREAMQDLLREGELEGVGGHDEMAIISGVVDFGETTVGEVMTPIADAFMLAEGSDPREIARQIAESAFSRVPVFRESRAHVVGMYHAFDVLKARGRVAPPLRPVGAASAAMPCNELLFRMLQARRHLAVVNDDRGQAIGIATLEDLLEKLVGDIRDEHDEPAPHRQAVMA